MLLLLTAVALIATGCSTLNTAQLMSAGSKALQAATLSDAQVEAYVGDYITQLDAQNTIATGNDPYAVRLNRIAGAINGRDGINIKVYRTKDVNAFAVADGSVRIYSGLMDIMSDEEILGVIGHEIGHVKNHDTRDAFRNALLTSAVREGIASAGGAAATLSASQLGDLGEAFAQSQYSQKQEYAADQYGYDFLKSHGLNPWAMALSLEKLRQMEAGGQTSGAVQQLFSTHPDLANRTQRLAARATQEGIARPK
jgi:putative metalloprotease